MPKIHYYIFFLIALSMTLFVSGCYTMIDYPQELEERYVDDPGYDQVYDYYEYGYDYDDYPYENFWGYYDPYYGFILPYNNHYYWDYPGWYYDDYYRNYGYYSPSNYAPEKKPETKYRGANIGTKGKNEYKAPKSLKKDEEETGREIQRPQSSRSAVKRELKNTNTSSKSKKQDEDN